jgi:hypothetical protein
VLGVLYIGGLPFECFWGVRKPTALAQNHHLRKWSQVPYALTAGMIQWELSLTKDKYLIRFFIIKKTQHFLVWYSGIKSQTRDFFKLEAQPPTPLNLWACENVRPKTAMTRQFIHFRVCIDKLFCSTYGVAWRLLVDRVPLHKRPTKSCTYLYIYIDLSALANSILIILISKLLKFSKNISSKSKKNGEW